MTISVSSDQVNENAKVMKSCIYARPLNSKQTRGIWTRSTEIYFNTFHSPRILLKPQFTTLKKIRDKLSQTRKISTK